MAVEANIIVASHKSEGKENCLSSFSNDEIETHRQIDLIRYTSDILVAGKLLLFSRETRLLKWISKK
jgi:hypothetical protein